MPYVARWPYLRTSYLRPDLSGQETVPLLDAMAAQVTPAQVGAADAAVNGPTARSAYRVTGAGIKIGILSDSFNLNRGETADITAGLLPASSNIHILKEGPAGSTDEGRAMAEIVHATAPDAQIYFYTAFDSEQDFANGIAALHAAGCQIIVDDTTYPDEPMFQVAGPIDTSVQQVLSAGTDYFTSAGNEGTAFFQSAFSPSTVYLAPYGTDKTAQIFSNGTPYQTVAIAANREVLLTLQWDAPFNTATSDSISVAAIVGNQIVARSTQVGNEPSVTLQFPIEPQGTTYQIVILYNAGTPMPGQFKYVLEGGGTINDPQAGVGSGSSLGHALVPGVNTVGAVDVVDTPAEGGTIIPEPFSSTGPGQILFAPDGTRLSAAQSPNVPTFLAPDGSATSVFDPFFGTSAAAPVAAATAALMLQAQPALSTGDVTVLLVDSAIPGGAATVAGAGLIQANLAVAFASTGVISGSAQAIVYGTSQSGTIVSAAATQEIRAGSGATVIQSFGNNTVVAGAGADTVDLAGPAALLYGGSGPLIVRTMSGQDTIAGQTGSVTVLGGIGGGSETGGTNGGNLLIAGLLPDVLVSGGPNDTLEAGGAGGDMLFAATAGAVTMTGGGSSGGNTYAALGTGSALVQTGPGGNVTYLGSGTDTVTTGGADIVVGGSGSVQLTESAGLLAFFGGTGTALITSGSGADTLFGGAGSMTLRGGSGTPLAFGGTAGGNLLEASTGESTLIGGGANDTIVGAGNGDVLLASAGGNDTLLAGSGTEIMVGGTSGTNVFALNGANVLVAPLSSTAVITMGSGESTVQSGSASEVIQLINGQAGGIDFVDGFNPAADILLLSGYDQTAAEQAVAGQYDTGGDSWLKLSDGTVVAFVGLNHLSATSIAFG